MGTRGLSIIVVDNEIKCAQYHQMDSYPSWQGGNHLYFLSKEMNEAFKDKVKACSWITFEEHKKYWYECGASCETNIITPENRKTFVEKHPYLDRDSATYIYSYIQNSDNGLKLQNNTDFAAETLYCEWVYVLDLDNNTFEVYKGYNYNPLTAEDRFYFLNDKSLEIYKQGGNYPPKLIKSYSLDNLPTIEEFISDLEMKEEVE